MSSADAFLLLGPWSARCYRVAACSAARTGRWALLLAMAGAVGPVGAKASADGAVAVHGKHVKRPFTRTLAVLWVRLEREGEAGGVSLSVGPRLPLREKTPVQRRWHRARTSGLLEEARNSAT